MANRYFNSQFLYNFQTMMVFLECNFLVGSSGAVSSTKGSGISSITHVGTGTYKIQFDDMYSRYLGGQFGFQAGVTGSSVPAASIVSGTTYIITSVGTTDFSAIGLPSGVTAAVGVAFTATGAGTGTGTVKAVGTSGITTCEVIGDPSLTLSNPTDPYILVQTLGPTDATHTALIPTDPTSGCTMDFIFFLRNSKNKGKGE